MPSASSWVLEKPMLSHEPKNSTGCPEEGPKSDQRFIAFSTNYMFHVSQDFYSLP